MKYFRFFTIIPIILLSIIFSYTYAQKPFTVVIDAGHGGHDSGAVGRYSKEKNINLAITKLLGEQIKNNYPDVKVVYTRTTDVFLTLQERADIVNRNNADIFFCIHTNATKGTTAFGTETYTLGLAKTQANLDVAMRENSVIMLEEDYKTKYQGFDPRSIDSYIMFEFMQDKYIDRSVQLASNIQRQFVASKRYDRGVRQAGFWVLHRSACPSVLIELGFISNRMEEDYLNSNSGREELSNAIFRAFTEYKRDHDKKMGVQTKAIKENNVPKPDLPDTTQDKEVKTTTPPVTETPTATTTQPALPATTTVATTSSATTETQGKVVFKIQLFAVDRKIEANSSVFKGLKHTSYYYEDGLYKYTYGEESSFDKMNKVRKSISGKFPQAYIIAFKDGKKIPIKDAMK